MIIADVGASLEDLMGCFPKLAEIDAERLAQRLKVADTSRVIESMSQIYDVASANPLVAVSALKALRFGISEVRHYSQVAEGQGSLDERAAALIARDRRSAYMLLVYRNFVARSVQLGGDISQLTKDTWEGIKLKGPEQFSDVAISIVVAALVQALLGPAAALSAFALSFRPLRDRAKRVVDKLSKKTQKTSPIEASKREVG